MQGAKLSMLPNTLTRLISLRSPSSDRRHSTQDIIDEKSGVPPAMVEALDRAEPLDPHLLAPRRRVLKRPAAQISRDSFKDRRACPHVLCSPHLLSETRKMSWPQGVETSTRRTSWWTEQRRTRWLRMQMTETSFRNGALVHDVLSSLHLGRRLDHSSRHVLTRATDQDEVAAVWRQAHEGWKICSEGGVWQKDVGLGCDLATAHGHTRWLGVTSVGSLLAA